MIGAKELFEEQREIEEYADHARLVDQHADAQFHSIRHCSKCKHNWSRLPVQDEEGDEQYEFCPVCNTDEHLTDYSSGDTFTFCPITGQIINDRTGQPDAITSVDPPKVSKSHQHFNPTKYEDRKEYNETIADKALAAYHKAFETGGQEAGEKAYREVFNTQQ